MAVDNDVRVMCGGFCQWPPTARRLTRSVICVRESQSQHAHPRVTMLAKRASIAPRRPGANGTSRMEDAVFSRTLVAVILSPFSLAQGRIREGSPRSD